jgi:hypothetical protein
MRMITGNTIEGSSYGTEQVKKNSICWRDKRKINKILNTAVSSATAMKFLTLC